MDLGCILDGELAKLNSNALDAGENPPLRPLPPKKGLAMTPGLWLQQRGRCDALHGGGKAGGRVSVEAEIRSPVLNTFNMRRPLVSQVDMPRRQLRVGVESWERCGLGVGTVKS